MKFDYCDVSKITEEELKNIYYLMNPKKQNKVKQYYRDIDKKCSICGELLVRKMINKYYGIKLEDIKIDIDDNGKPYAIGLDLEFNVSHTDNIAVCVISNAKAGIDIERIRPINLSMVKTFCNREEMRYIFNHDPIEEEFTYSDNVEILTRFFEVWTSKEAYVKCLGDGISLMKKSHPRNVKTFKLFNDYIVSIYKECQK